MNNRLKNYGLWVSVFSLFMLTLQNSGVGVDVGKWTTVFNQLLQILVLLGILNNPDTDHKGFFDDRKDD